MSNTGKKTRKTAAHKGAESRPTIFDQALADEICDLIAGGSNLVRVCADPKFPTRSTVYNWFDANPAFFDRYARARKDRADWRSDRIDEVCQKVEAGIIGSQEARVIIDALKWQAGKEDQGKYGEKVTNEHTGANGGPILTKSITFEGVGPDEE